MPESIARLARVLLALTVILLSLGAGAPSLPQEEPPATEHVVLVSIDGLRPEFYLDPKWPAPVIQQMARQGAHARGVTGVFPTVTYPSHTTLVTGALPARHGVYYNTPFEPGGQTGRWYWEASEILVPTLWDAVRDAGLDSAAVSWPATVGAPVDRVIPEVWSLDENAPPLRAMRQATVPAGLWEEIEREATGKLSERTFDNDEMNRDDTAGRAAAYLLERYRPALLAVHLLATDHFQHEQGRQGELVTRAVATADRAVGMILEAAQRAGIADRTAFVVTGDHGFVDVHTRLAPNRWLADAGLMEARHDRGDWSATFHSSGGSAFLHLRDPEDGETLSRVKAILNRLSPAYRRLFRVVGEDELRARGADPSVRLALTAAPGITFTAAPDRPVLGPSGGGTHGYYPDFPEVLTGFVGFGSGFRAQAVADEMAMEDIAPLIARLLGLQFEAPDGVVLEGLLEEYEGGR